ncbi:MAG: ATP-binding protein [Candidatus Gribaldobacteria bacterium]|nr:ATP-binding protein [Candidatus Gribaldobacteria bacterium]
MAALANQNYPTGPPKPVRKNLVQDQDDYSAVPQKNCGGLNKKAQELVESKQALLNILEDVELERKLAEGERDRTLAIIKNLADGIIILEKNVITLCNPKIEIFFSLLPDNILGKSFQELVEDQRIGSLFRFLQEKGLDLDRVEFQPNDNLTLEVSALNIKGLGKEMGKMIVLHDITREKAVEQMKTEFVTIAAHQLRTPLSAIKWIMNMMLEGDLGQLSDSQKEFLQKTHQSNERMIRLVNDLLNVTRIEEGRFLYELKPYDIIKLTEKALAPLKELALQKGLDFVFEKPSSVIPPIYVDEEKFGIVIQNLVDNAINYTKQGKVLVSMAWDKPKEEVYFMVKDNGIGIPPDQQKRVFSRFFRSPNAVKTETEGTGLGLFIAKNIIEAHLGKIWFESQEGHGATFFFVLPRDPRQR